MTRGARQVMPGQIYQTVSNMLASRMSAEAEAANFKPVWFDPVGANPPTQILVRPLPPQVAQPFVTGSASKKPKSRKPSRMFQPQKIVYEEDSLRSKFYKDHPWELARPRMIIETDGKDTQHYDWSRGLRQPGLPLSGESVVQRQLWMMYNVPNLTREKAYDMARHEFYVLRQQEEIEARVAREEASHLGAYFGKSHLQISTQLEDNQFEHWKKWAARQIADKKLSNESAYTSFGEEEEVADEDEDYAVDAPEAEPSPVVTRS